MVSKDFKVEERSEILERRELQISEFDFFYSNFFEVFVDFLVVWGKRLRI